MEKSATAQSDTLVCRFFRSGLWNSFRGTWTTRGARVRVVDVALVFPRCSAPLVAESSRDANRLDHDSIVSWHPSAARGRNEKSRRLVPWGTRGEDFIVEQFILHSAVRPIR